MCRVCIQNGVSTLPAACLCQHEDMPCKTIGQFRGGVALCLPVRFVMCYERGVFVVDLVDGGMYACQYVHMSVGAILAGTHAVHITCFIILVLVYTGLRVWGGGGVLT